MSKYNLTTSLVQEIRDELVLLRFEQTEEEHDPGSAPSTWKDYVLPNIWLWLIDRVS